MRHLIYLFALISCSVINTEYSNFVPSSQNLVSNTDLSLFYDNVQYDDLNLENLDIFLSDEVGATPVVINFHGGGFVQGSKENTYQDTDEVQFIEDLLLNGISFVNVDYELIDSQVEEFGVIRSLSSARRAIQFISYHASFLNIDVNNIILRGSSAGSGISMWYAYNVFTDLSNDNPIYNENPAIKGTVLHIPQATYDILQWDTVFSNLNYSAVDDINNNPASLINLLRFYGIDTFQEVYSPEITTYRDDVDMIRMIGDNGGVPTWLDSSNLFFNQVVNYTIQDINHNAYHGKSILEALTAEGTECIAYLNGLNYDDPGGENELNFIIRQAQ